MPPLFEVMRQTNPNAPQPAGGPSSSPTPPAHGDGSSTNQAFFRAHTQPEPTASAGLRLTTDQDADTSPAPASPARPAPTAAAPVVAKPVEVRVGQARRNWVVEDTGRDEAPESASAAGGTPPTRPVRTPLPKAPMAIPGTWLAVAAAVGLALIVVVWIVAYRTGSTAKEHEFQDKLSSSAPVGPTNPAKPAAGTPGATPSGSALPPEHRPARDPDPKSDPGSGAKPPVVPPPAPPAPAVTDVAPAVDPRQAETNYLSVLTLRAKDEAVELAKYLSDAGLPTATVALKATGGSAAVGWEVFVLQGIPSVDFRRADAKRNAIHTKLEELGRTWNQEGRSRLNFARDNVTWRKFKPGS